MKITRVTGHNFWSFEDFDQPLDSLGLSLIEGSNLDEGGSNGAGKSAFHNAIMFALFGILPKDVKVDEIINDKTGKECLVELFLSEGNRELKISRGRKPNILSFTIDGEKKEDVNAAKTQQLIEKTLGITYDTVINSIYFHQNSNNFLDYNDEAKKTVLTDLLDLGIYDTACDLVKDSSKKIDNELLVLDTEISSLQTNYMNLHDTIDSYKKQLEEFEIKKQNNISNLEKEKAGVFDSISGVDEKIKSFDKELLASKEKLAEFNESYDIKIKAITTLKENVSELNESKSHLQYEIDTLSKQIGKYQLKTASCPTCFQKTDNKLLEKLKKQDEDKLLNLKYELTGLSAKISKELSLIELDNKKNKLTTEQRDLTSQISSTERDILYITKDKTTLENKIKDFDKRIEDVKNESNIFQELLDKELSKKTGITKSINEKQRLVAERRSLSGQLVELKEVFSNKGIKASIFDAVVNELNYRVNEYLSQLFESNVRLEFSTESTNAKGIVKQVFSTKCTINDKEVGLGRFSGGEKRRLDVAVNFSLADIIASRSQKTFNILLLDEAFDGLDYDGKRRVMDILNDMQKTRDAILVIDHLSDFQSCFNNVIKIEKENGVSRIV